MSTRVILSIMALGALGLNAQMLKYSVKGYENAIANGWSLYDNYDKSLKACFDDKFKATDKIWDKYSQNDFKHINGSIIELCNYQQQVQYNSDRYIVYCSNLEKGFEDISKAEGWGGDLQNEAVGSKESLAYSISVKDNNYSKLNYNALNSFEYKLKNHNNAMKVNKPILNSDKTESIKIDIIEDAYNLYEIDTTGRISLENKGNAIGYLLDQSPINDNTNLKEFYNVIVGSQYRQLVSDNEYYQQAFNSVKQSNIENKSKLLEKALLKNLKAIEYVGYVDYPIKWGNEGKCYTFDITKFDSVNVSDNENERKALIRARNFLYNQNTGLKYYFQANEKRQYSIHKSNLSRAGVYEKSTAGANYLFSINVRAQDNNAKGEVLFRFYPDANNLTISDKKLYLSSANTALAKREAGNKYYLKGSDGRACELSLDNTSKNLVFNQGNCDIKQSNIEIIEKIGDFERPIFQESGRDIVKGFINAPKVADNLVLKTAYVDDEKNSVIKDGKVNKSTQYGSAIYTTLANNDFYVQVDALDNDVYIDFSPNGNFSIIAAYDDKGLVEKDKESTCKDKYKAKKLVLKLKANNPKQVNTLKYTQYEEQVINGEKVCKQLATKDDGYDFNSNEFAIRPKEFEIGISNISQEAFKMATKTFNAKDLKGFQDLGIGLADLIIEFEGLSKKFALLNSENSKITAFSNDSRLNAQESTSYASINNNGDFDLRINFPLATEGKIELAETNFAKKDKELGLCDANFYDKTTANISKNGKISCFIPMKNLLDINFTANTKALNDEYVKCENDISKCEGYDLTTNQIDLSKLQDKIGIKNTNYNKIMLGDKEGLIYTLDLVSKNSNNKFVPTKFKDEINIGIDLGNLGNLVVNEGSTKKINISVDELNAAFKKAFDELGQDAKLSNLKEYTKEEASYKNVSNFTFKKEALRPVQKITLSVFVDGKDDFGIAYSNAFDVAYTGLIFKDIKISGANKTLELGKDCEFGYYDSIDSKLVFIKDTRHLSLGNVLDKISLTSDYQSTIINDYTLTSNSKSSYIKDTIRFAPKTGFEYLSNAKNTFTIEFK